MATKTVLTKATSKSDSLRTTVPAAIVKQFNLKESDELEWEMVPKKSQLMIIVSVVYKENKENNECVEV